MSGSLEGRAGSKWRLSHGGTRSGNEPGSMMHALPDWEFADGRPAPVRPSVRLASLRHKRTQERIERLKSEVDGMIEKKLSESSSTCQHE
ncbi:MAG: hypothetical protein Q8P67_14970 [archaeon]|nr:hypothetical protein [archaeon]